MSDTTEKTETIAHLGRPFDPPLINTSTGQLTFEPDPDGSKYWLAKATPEQALELVQFGFFKRFDPTASAALPDASAMPDETWTRAGIAEWAQKFLEVEIETKLKADMLADLQAALAAKAAKDAASAETTSAAAPASTTATVAAPAAQ